MAQATGNALLWPLRQEFPGPAAEAVLAALPLPVRRCLRAACRGGRAAIDARVRSLSLPRRELDSVRVYDVQAGNYNALEHAAPRFAALEHLELGYPGLATPMPGGAAELAAAIDALPPGVRDISVRAPYGENLWRALARRAGRLQGIHFTTLDSRHMPKVLELAAVAPGLDFTLDYCVLGLGPLLLDAQLPPWAQLQGLTLSSLQEPEMLIQLCALPPLPSLRTLGLRGLGDGGGSRRHQAPLWAWLARACSGLTSLQLDVNIALRGPAGGGPGGTCLPALRELVVHEYGSRIIPAHAARLAACRLPALTALKAGELTAGALAPLLAAPWAQGLRRLSLAGHIGHSEWFTGGPAAFAALSALTSLELKGPPLGATHMVALLAAPLGASLQHLDLEWLPLDYAAAGADVRRARLAALAAAPLPRLRSLSLMGTGLAGAEVAELSARALWLPQLTALVLMHETNYGWRGGWAALACAPLRALRKLHVAGCGPARTDALRALRSATVVANLTALYVVANYETAVLAARFEAIMQDPRSAVSQIVARGGGINCSIYNPAAMADLYPPDDSDDLEYYDGGGGESSDGSDGSDSGSDSGSDEE